ncbi:MAG: hypothetical protein GF313_09480, partial [Caldithrix sp.]|nr:hypothetical protein [Caldithrix sp.]
MPPILPGFFSKKKDDLCENRPIGLSSMSQLNIHCSGSVSFYYFREDIIKRAQGATHNYLAIFPVNRAVRIFQKELIDAVPGNVLINPPLFTFNQLLVNVYERMPDRGRIVTDDMALLLVKQFVAEAPDSFRYLIQNRHVSQGLLRKVHSIIQELRRFGFTAQTFSQLNPDEKESFPHKFSDLTDLLNDYEISLGPTLIDEPFALYQAARDIDERLFRRIWPDTETIFIAGYGMFTPAMYQFIEKTAQWCEVHVKLDYRTDNPHLFRQIRDAAERFRKIGGRFFNMEDSSNLGYYLFNRDIDVRENKLNLSNQIKVTPLQNKSEEIAFIAGEIRRLYKEENIPLHRIAVTFSQMDIYAPLVRTIFNNYNIPYNLSTGFYLNQSPLIQTFLKVLHIINMQFETEPTIKFIKNGFLDKRFEIDTFLISKLCAQRRITHLRKGWEKNIAEYTQTVADPDEDKPAPFDAQRITEEVTKLNNLLEMFYTFPRDGRITTFREAYISLLKNLHLLQWYEYEIPYLTERQREHEFRAFNRFMKLFERAIWTLKYMHKDKVITFSVFYENLQLVIGEGIYNLSELPDYGVQIMPRLEIQALECDVLFIGGLVDGEFPRTTMSDVFFNDGSREVMGLIQSSELFFQDRLIFYSLLNHPARQKILTYPEYEEEAALVPSSFIADLTDVAIVHEESVTADDDRFYHHRILWERLGNVCNYTDFSRAGELDAARQTIKLLFTASDKNFQRQKQQLLDLLNRIKRVRQRSALQLPTRYEGSLGKSDGVYQLLHNLFSKKIWSPTSLEQYAFCPINFFFGRVLQIEEWPKMEKEMTNAEKGWVVHKIFQRFYIELKNKNQVRSPAHHKVLLHEIAHEEFNTLAYAGFLWELELTTFYGGEEQKGLLDTFVDYDQEEIAAIGYIPAHFEWAFGLRLHADADPQSVPRAIRIKTEQGTLSLQGKIDRVDVHPQTNHALLFDYKTGKSSISKDPEDIRQGLRFQLPLYALALQEEFDQYNAVYGGYYLVKDDQNCLRIPQFFDRDAFPVVSGNPKSALPGNKVIDDKGNPLTMAQLLEKSKRRAVQTT